MLLEFWPLIVASYFTGVVISYYGFSVMMRVWKQTNPKLVDSKTKRLWWFAGCFIFVPFLVIYIKVAWSLYKSIVFIFKASMNENA